MFSAPAVGALNANDLRITVFLTGRLRVTASVTHATGLTRTSSARDSLGCAGSGTIS